MVKLYFLVLGMLFLLKAEAQPVEVRADYNSSGDVDFVAYNNTRAPLFLNISFDDLENTTFDEPLPYIKQLEPGFNALFSLLHDPGSGEYPRFHYDINYYRSNPAAQIELSFPYLIPFEPGTTVRSFSVENISGFWGQKEFKSWSATGFKTKTGQRVCAARTGIIAEISAAKQDENAMVHYNTWNYSVTLLQPDGTLACYKNVDVKDNTLKVGQKVFAGQLIGEMAPGTTELLFLVYHESFFSDDPIFIIPEFVVSEMENELVLSDKEYLVLHPEDVCNRELTKKEIRSRRKN